MKTSTSSAKPSKKSKVHVHAAAHADKPKSRPNSVVLNEEQISCLFDGAGLFLENDEGEVMAFANSALSQRVSEGGKEDLLTEIEAELGFLHYAMSSGNPADINGNAKIGLLVVLEDIMGRVANLHGKI